jgi:alkylation response protein AidB-like acyl-CoA dehydrogenase
MDFSFTPEEERFRAELRAFIDAELPAWWRGMFVDDARVFPETRRFCRKLAERGWLTMAWPREHGGEEAGVWKQTILREEMWAHDEPRGPQYMNLNYIGPCIMRFGTAEQKRRFLPPMAAGDVIWTQGFSEPGAGSDLAALTTRAEDRGDHFVVNGQKTWNSYADAPADWCFLLARTDRAAARHAGLSVLLVDMRTPGITVRPIGTIAGPHEFAEIFFDDVVVPRDSLLGEKNQGWTVATTGLTFERVGIARYARAGYVIEQLVRYACEAGLGGDPDVRQKLAELRVRYEAARLLSYRAVSLQAAQGLETGRAGESEGTREGGGTRKGEETREGPGTREGGGSREMREASEGGGGREGGTSREGEAARDNEGAGGTGGGRETGESASVAASIARLHNTQLEQLVGHVGLEILGLTGQLTHDDPQAPLGGLLWRQWVRNIPTTIAAGTLEIQKNIIARRGLGLPRAG